GAFDVLDQTLSALARARPDERIFLIGHSMGGVLGLDAVRRSLADSPPLWAGHLAGLAAFDSPLLGISSERALTLDLGWGLARGCLDSSLIQMLTNMGSDTSLAQRNRELVARALDRGQQIGTAGNRLDCLYTYTPGACRLPIPIKLPDDSATQVIDNARLGWYMATRSGRVLV